MLTIVLKPGNAPQGGGYSDEYKNVATVGGQNTNTGTAATDRANFLTAAAAAVTNGNFSTVVYADEQGTTRTVILLLSDVRAVL